jgi:dienelactone hydrolase
MNADPIFTTEGDADAARALVKATPDAKLYLYPGNQHLFADSSVPSSAPMAAAEFLSRTVAFLRTR